MEQINRILTIVGVAGALLAGEVHAAGIVTLFRETHVEACDQEFETHAARGCPAGSALSCVRLYEGINFDPGALEKAKNGLETAEGNHLSMIAVHLLYSSNSAPVFSSAVGRLSLDSALLGVMRLAVDSGQMTWESVDRAIEKQTKGKYLNYKDLQRKAAEDIAAYNDILLNMIVGLQSVQTFLDWFPDLARLGVGDEEVAKVRVAVSTSLRLFKDYSGKGFAITVDNLAEALEDSVISEGDFNRESATIHAFIRKVLDPFFRLLLAESPEIYTIDDAILRAKPGEHEEYGASESNIDALEFYTIAVRDQIFAHHIGLHLRYWAQAAGKPDFHLFVKVGRLHLKGFRDWLKIQDPSIQVNEIECSK